MNAIIFDTETNGKIKNWKLPLNRENVSSFPRITEIAWQKLDLKTGAILNEFQSLIKPDGWTVPKEEFFEANNMSTERCEEFGAPLVGVLDKLIVDLNDSEIVVAHNLNFDIKVLGAEFFRYDLKVDKKLIKVCTMESSIAHCKLPPFRFGKYKFPKLVELYKILFDKEMENNHEAFADVVGCRECFVKLIKLNIINV